MFGFFKSKKDKEKTSSELAALKQKNAPTPLSSKQTSEESGDVKDIRNINLSATDRLNAVTPQQLKKIQEGRLAAAKKAREESEAERAQEAKEQEKNTSDDTQTKIPVKTQESQRPSTSQPAAQQTTSTPSQDPVENIQMETENSPEAGTSASLNENKVSRTPASQEIFEKETQTTNQGNTPTAASDTLSESAADKQPAQPSTLSKNQDTPEHRPKPQPRIIMPQGLDEKEQQKFNTSGTETQTRPQTPEPAQTEAQNIAENRNNVEQAASTNQAANNSTTETPEKQQFTSAYLGKKERKRPIPETPTPENTVPQPPIDTPLTQNPQEQAPDESGEEKLGAARKPKSGWIRTYRDDFKKSVADQGAGAVSKLLKKEDAKRARRKANRTLSPKNIAILIISIFLFLGSLALVFFLFVSNAPEPTAPTAPPPLVRVNNTEEFIINQGAPKDIYKVLNSKKNTEIATSTITYLAPIESFPVETSEGTKMTKRYATPLNVFSALESEAPLRLLQTLTGEGMFGLYSTPGGNQPFIILKTDFYENAFSGMLSWEKDLTRNFSLWFGLKPSFGENSQIETEDLIIHNKDVRRISTPEGKTLLLYAFRDQATIVITTNQTTLEELFRRLNYSQ